jgi:hypothetical protein
MSSEEKGDDIGEDKGEASIAASGTEPRLHAEEESAIPETEQALRGSRENYVTPGISNV